jgi:hypothetical protein
MPTSYHTVNDKTNMGERFRGTDVQIWTICTGK